MSREEPLPHQQSRSFSPLALSTRFALVFAGGMVGTAVRAGLGLIAHPEPESSGVHFPVTTLVINIVGAFLLGYVLESIARRGAGARSSEALRLAVGTGLLGGFTTYSALSVDTVTLASVDVAAAVIYSSATLICGACASWAGIWAASRRRDQRASGPQRPAEPRGDTE